MGFVIGSSCFLQYPLYQSRLPSSSQSLLCYSCLKNPEFKRKYRAPMASLLQEDPNDGAFCKRRAVLMVGITVLPLLQMRARALEGLATTESKTPEENQKIEEAPETDSQSNFFLSLLNGIGIIASGVLGALYALDQKEMRAAHATIETMKERLKENEEAVISLSRNFESKLLSEEEEHTKQLRKAMDEQQALVKELSLAKSTISGLGKELNSKRRLVEGLKHQIESLETNLSKADTDRKDLEKALKEKSDSVEVLQERINLLSLGLNERQDLVRNLSSSLTEKDLELKNLHSTHKQTMDELSNSNSQILGLKDELLKNQRELESKNSVVDELNVTVSSLTLEEDESKRKYDSVQKEYNDLKLSYEKKVALDAKLLGEKEHEIYQLKEKLELALNEVSRNQDTITDLTQERENFKESLEIKLSNVKNLKQELQVTHEHLGKSRNDASDMEKQLRQSQKLCIELGGEVSRVSAELADVRGTLQRSVTEAKCSGELLASELMTTKEHLKKTQEELDIMSRELSDLVENHDNLRKELVDVYKKAETTAHDLKEKKQIVSSLNKELQLLEKEIPQDKEARRTLEMDLEEATKSLDEMNQNALVLSKELENAYSLTSNLNNEKEVLYKSLTEEKNASKEARENLEVAHDLVLKLGKGRENLQNKAKKLEEDLAFAKGEILRLRSQLNSSKVLANNSEQPQKDEDEHKVTVNAKKPTRRRNVNPEQ
ncbi:MAR-binding filament-like protein 1-1 [Quillaja saponaria]|uniref:MAR-binding filament-like protein 1-1 n=1 Tax=Quillaja saponaria TaxID=32244 RepID=A0AAD7L5H6_QUISA|nr:MAR-binding filament-like protein 1-1 [Quillaja saponaria]